MIDSIFASDGILPEPTPFLKPAADVVHAAGGLLIADEVQPGFGRLGASMWGFERHGLLPDIVTMGKPMGNGMPIAGLVMQGSLAEQFGRDLRYFNTFGGNPVTVAAAQAVLDVIRDEDLVANSAAMGNRILTGLRETSLNVEFIGDVRGAGLFVGVEFIGPAGQPDPAEALRVVNGMKQRGVLISATGFVRKHAEDQTTVDHRGSGRRPVPRTVRNGRGLTSCQWAIECTGPNDARVISATCSS
ncbi:MAG: aminotransferase class III-fold pyridoxal phosphate-dependent enzyme [Rhodococcus sp. (in: high G+C Gram-positive bacteria)]|nr:aminotransferase class III-fold pyridoxal phosphate-dependent enzyme [Rhodococcus sp. (in: high G+C Gram-positive bacteria)]